MAQNGMTTNLHFNMSHFSVHYMKNYVWFSSERRVVLEFGAFITPYISFNQTKYINSIFMAAIISRFAPDAFLH